MGPGVWVVVGLGNPGEAYEATRHNIGFRVVDGLLRRWGGRPEPFPGPAQVSRADWDGREVVLVKPTTYMNRSGDALAGAPFSEAAGPGRHLIVYDDVDLPFGSLRFRKRGGAGGHNGLASVLERFGTQDVPRLRMGIGWEEREETLRDFVLAPFSPEETKSLDQWVDRAMQGVRVFVERGPEASMNQFNQQKS